MIEQRRATSREFISKELERLTKELERQVSSGEYPTLDEQMGLINMLKEKFFSAVRNTHTSAIKFEQYDYLNPVKQALMTRSISWDVAGAYNRIDRQFRCYRFHFYLSNLYISQDLSLSYFNRFGPICYNSHGIGLLNPLKSV